MSKKCDLHYSEMVRKSYQRLPGQGLWTWITAKELPDRETMWRSTGLECLLWSCLWFFGGIAGAIVILKSDINSIWLLLPTLFTVGGARYIVATIIHHAVHHTVFDTPLANKVVAEVFSTITLVQPYESYRRFHVFEHHGKDFSTEADQDLAAIYKLGLCPGLSVPELKLILLAQCINPLFHLSFFFGRIKSNIVGVPFYRLSMTVAWLSILACTAYWLGLKDFLVAILLPCTVLYQICSLLHLVTEHAWVIRAEDETVKQSHHQNSLGRFCGEAVPYHHSKVVSSIMWAVWVFKHLAWHIPCRILFVQGSLAVHDWHHRHGGKRDWPNAIQHREEEVQKEKSQGAYTYTDIWGFSNCVEYSLTRISESSLTIDTTNLSYRLN